MIIDIGQEAILSGLYKINSQSSHIHSTHLFITEDIHIYIYIIMYTTVFARTNLQIDVFMQTCLYVK